MTILKILYIIFSHVLSFHFCLHRIFEATTKRGCCMQWLVFAVVAFNAVKCSYMCYWSLFQRILCIFEISRQRDCFIKSFVFCVYLHEALIHAFVIGALTNLVHFDISTKGVSSRKVVSSEYCPLCCNKQIFIVAATFYEAWRIELMCY